MPNCHPSVRLLLDNASKDFLLSLNLPQQLGRISDSTKLQSRPTMPDESSQGRYLAAVGLLETGTHPLKTK